MPAANASASAWVMGAAVWGTSGWKTTVPAVGAEGQRHREQRRAGAQGQRSRPGRHPGARAEEVDVHPAGRQVPVGQQAQRAAGAQPLARTANTGRSPPVSGSTSMPSDSRKAKDRGGLGLDT